MSPTMSPTIDSTELFWQDVAATIAKAEQIENEREQDDSRTHRIRLDEVFFELKALLKRAGVS